MYYREVPDRPGFSDEGLLSVVWLKSERADDRFP
jgi:hypothetical protein